ncbi:insulinase family protein [Nitrincola sp.]|uniref:insulinase family protein n=1 Tax=Nitrincola sp. TaxID=1926584 RepID=UPI003A92BB70
MLRVIFLVFLISFSGFVPAQVIQSPYDNRSLETLILPNQLKVLLISDPAAEKAAASLDVAVGSAANPVDIPGLAHFLEHMLFLGTEKYPEADSYQSYINANGGSHNAFTAYENTNYFFDVRPEALAGALDRFSRFFIDPLFTPDYVQRERHAVESEFQAKRRDDNRRIHEVTKQVMNPEHSWSNFAVGDLHSLSDGDNTQIRDALINFYQQYYSANLMSLVISGPQTLDELRELVEMRFSDIANFQAEPYVDQVPLFTEDQLPLQLEVQTLRQHRTLSLTFPVDPIRDHWRSKPLYFIGSLLGYEGEGSLFSLLKSQQLATGLSAYTAIDLPGQASFQVNIELTDDGLNQIDRITSLFFGYVNLLQKQGLNANLYQEESELAVLQFQFRDQPQPIHEVMMLAQMQQRYPVENLLNANYLLESFEPELINSYLQQLNPDNLLLTLQHPQVTPELTEKRYNAGYRFAAIEPQRLNLWQEATPEAELQLRELNPFIPDSLALTERDDPATDLPVMLRDEPGFSLWYQQDQQFQRPRADVYFAFMTHLALASAENAVMLELYTRILNDQMNEMLYDASLAGLNVSLYPHLRGFSMQISGYNDKQPLLLDSLLQEMQHPEITPARFERVRQQFEERLINQRQEGPYQLAMQQLFTTLMSRWSTEDRLEALESVTPEQLEQFLAELFTEAEVRLLAHGNITADMALSMGQQIQTQLLPNTRPVTGIQVPVVKIPTDTPLTDTLKLAHNDATLVRYLQAADRSLEKRAAVALLNEILSTPFYSRLRTDMQLGYIVFANYLPMGDVPGLALIVQSPVADPLKLESHFDDFLSDMHTQLQALSDEQLEDFRIGLRSRLLQPDTKLSERSQRYWRELDRDGAFTTHQQIAEQVSDISRDDLIAVLAELQTRQYQIRSFGNLLPETDAEPTIPDFSGYQRLQQQRSESHFH